MSATDSSSESYFHAVEETFIRLRGAPLLLSPADWQVAKKGRQDGVPLELVARVMEEVFERLKERDPVRRVQSLRYCAPAVEEAWREVQDLSIVAGRMEAEPIDISGRLQVLSAQLPTDPPAVEKLRQEVLSLSGSAEQVEESLVAMERRLLDELSADLDGAIGDRLRTRAAESLERMGGRVAPADWQDLEGRLIRELLRMELGLPTLSLFAVADPPSAD